MPAGAVPLNASRARRSEVYQATDTRLMPWIARLTPLPVRKHHIDLLGRMTMVRISRVRRHEAHADPDIAPYLKPLRAHDCRVGVAVQELLAKRFGASPDLPGELRFDAGKGIGQSADRTWLTARVFQRRRQMAADGQSRAAWPRGLGRRRLERREHPFGSQPHRSIDTGLMPNRCFGRSQEQLEIGGTERRHLWDLLTLVDILA